MGDTVNNTAIGSALIIPDGLLNNLTKIDKKIKDIQDTSRATANVFNNSFASMSMGLKTGILTQLQQVINQLGSVGQAAQTASSATQNMGSGLGTAAQGATNLGTSVTGVVEAINRMIGQLQQTGQVGSSSLMAAKLAADKLMEAMQFKNTGNIAAIKDEILNINKTLKDTESALSRSEQQTLVERKRLLQEELKEAERTQNERAVNLQRVLDRMIRAEQNYQRQVEQARKKTAQDYQKQNYASNTTYSGSLSFADNANTINRRTQAIKYLTEARNSLSKTDADYINKLATLNAKIKELNAVNRQAIASSQELNNSHRRLMDTSGQLQRAFALLFSVSQIRGYVNQIAKVRGEFELQQRSLEAILQNKTEADTIFNKTVALAVQSPFQIRELVSYTKQLAAYRIESDKLYDTTKRLADVSAGLGVDMQRLILAYGQVKAAAYLRGTEVRQFTEAGINLYGELQRYFQEVKGEAYTTAQIVDMISKRMVTFEDVEQIFKRITDQGGIFYRMQEIQAETLQGKIANFKDSVDVMMNEIGKDNEGLFKGAIDSATALLGHWEAVVNVGKALVGVLIAIKLQSALTNKELLRMLIMSKIAKDGTKMASVVQVLQLGFMKLTKSIKTTVSGLGLFIKTNPILAATTVLAAGLYEVYSHFSEINEALDENKRKYEEAIQPINALTAEYIQLANAMKRAKEAGESDFDFGENRKGRESIIRKIADELEKENIKIDLSNLGALNDEQLQSKSEELIKRYKGIKKSVQEMSNAYSKLSNEVEGWFGLFGDNIKTDMEDLKRSEADVLSGGASITAQLNLLGANYNELSENAKKYYDTVKGGQNIKAGESEVEYLERVHKAISEIMKLDWGKSVIEELQNIAIKANIDWKAFRKDKDNFLYEVRKMKADFEKQGITDPWDVAVAINTVASENNWSEYEKNIAKREFKVPLVFDQQKVDEQIDTIDKQLKRAFENKTYNVTIKTNGLDFLSASKEEKKTMDVQLARLKELVAERDRANRATIKLDNYDALQVNAEINTLRKNLTAAGYDLSSIFGTNKNKAAAKAQRDILSEQISLLKEMQKRYEDLQSVMGKSDAIQSVLQYYSASLQNVKMPQSIVNSFVPTKEGLINALEKLLPTINDFKKKMDVRNTIAELKVQIDKEKLKTDLDEVKKEINAMFSGLDLHKKLKDAGLTEEEVKQLFPGLAKSLDDVQAGIEERYKKNFPKGEYLKEGTEANEQYIKDIQELNDKRVKEQEDLVIELTKKYKTQLSDQLQLDKWYAEERAKIELANLTPEQKEQYRANLKKQYDQKSADNAWKEFTSSDSYLNLFDNIEYYSTAALQGMKDRLTQMREELKDLSPTELKQIMEQEAKLDQQLNSRNPWTKLSKALKDYTKQRKDNAKNEEAEAAARDKQAELTIQLRNQSKIVAGKEAALKSATENVDIAQEEYDKEKEIYDQLKKKKEKQDEIVNGYDAANRALSLQAQKLQGIIQSLGKIDFGGGMVESISGITNSVSDFAHMLEDSFGVAIGDDFYEILDGVGALFGSLESFDIQKPVSSSINVLTGLGKTIGSIFGFGNKDKKLQKEIENQARIINRLQHAYENLKKSMDDAWSAASVIQANKDTKENIQAQISSYEKMIASEKDKKDSDSGKIEEWQNQIDDLKQTLKELDEQAIEAMGGFGSEANYKSAAQEFADAWVDAFNESGDTLKALEDKFDDFFNNLIKKQLMQRAAQKYLRPLFEAIDRAVSEDSEGGVALTEEEKNRIQKLKDMQLKGFDEYAKMMMELLNIKPNGGVLSKLQQGIEGITETTAQALESLLNSIRYFVAQQTTDISAIRLLLQQLNSVDIQTPNNTPMLTELRSQTTYLRQIRDTLSDVVRPSGHPKQGAGVKVFID